MSAILKGAGVGLGDVVKVNVYLREMSRDFAAMNEVYLEVSTAYMFVRPVQCNAEMEVILLVVLQRPSSSADLRRRSEFAPGSRRRNRMRGRDPMISIPGQVTRSA